MYPTLPIISGLPKSAEMNIPVSFVSIHCTLSDHSKDLVIFVLRIFPLPFVSFIIADSSKSVVQQLRDDHLFYTQVAELINQFRHNSPIR